MDVSKEDPIVPMPQPDETALGGHSMSVVGYSLLSENFLCKNSFGTEWGDDGYCWLPFEYVRKYAFEKWCFDIPKQ